MTAAVLALLASFAIAVGVLARQRSRTRLENHGPDQPAATGQPVLKRRLSRQQRILAKLEPLPEIPTVMDLMREEIAETGVENIGGHEGLTGPVMLKVHRRDKSIRDRCTHDAYEFVVREDVDPPEATEDNVVLFCNQCGELETDEETGTDSDESPLL